MSNQDTLIKRRYGKYGHGVNRESWLDSLMRRVFRIPEYTGEVKSVVINRFEDSSKLVGGETDKANIREVSPEMEIFDKIFKADQDESSLKSYEQKDPSESRIQQQRQLLTEIKGRLRVHGTFLSDIGELKDIEADPVKESLSEDRFTALRDRFTAVLGERVKDVRESKTLTGRPAQLVSDETDAGRNINRGNRLRDRDNDLPVKALELNPRHPLIHNLSEMLASQPDNPLAQAVIEQVFATALLEDVIYPDPASMQAPLTLLMESPLTPRRPS